MTSAGTPVEAPSPNHGERTTGSVDMIILHYTGMAEEDQALGWLCNPESGVSSHYFVYEDGRTARLVGEDRRAWHAGISCWNGETDINSRSIGIEIANFGHAALAERCDLPSYPDRQIDAVVALCQDIVSRIDIPPQRILAHSDIAPARKSDPGEAFPWDRLATAGIGHWVTPEPVTGGRFLSRGDQGEPVEALQAMLSAYGYDVPVSGRFDERTQQVVTAFQRHFRPERVDGIADASTIATLNKLIRSLP